MRQLSILVAVFLALTVHLFAQVETTFKTVADGQEEYNGQPINKPDFSLTGGGGISLPSRLPSRPPLI
jgi:hypothetical protein